MQITQTVSEDLRRQFTVTVAASELDSRVTTRLEEMKPRVNLKGFRPGKAPVSFLKKQFGKSVMGESSSRPSTKAARRRSATTSSSPRCTPRIEPVGDVQQVVDGKADLQFTVTVDLMPEFETTDVAKLKVERLTAEVTDADVRRGAGAPRQAEPRLCRPRRRRSRRRRTISSMIDFVGSVDGVEFEGGKGEDFNLTLGSGQFIPGFEDQLIGAKAGEQRDVKVTFPAEYHAADLAGKDAVFAVTVKEVKAPDEAKIDDELAKKMGLDDLAHPEGPRARADQGRFRRRQPPASEAPHPGCAGRRPHLPAAARDGGSRVRPASGPRSRPS